MTSVTEGRGSLESAIATLMSSSLLTGLLGVAFWAVASRGFPVAEVGTASVVMSTATMLATLACLSLGSMYERFLPVAGESTARYVALGTGLVAAASVVLGVGFLVVGPADRLFSSGPSAALFPVLVAVLALFALLDPILVGLGRSRQVAVKNVGQSVAKLVALLLLIPVGTATALVGSWAVTAAAAAAVAAIVLVSRVLPESVGPPRLPARRELWTFYGGSYLMTALGTAVPLAVPLIVLAGFGTEANAYFGIVWLMVATVDILIATAAAPFVAAAAGTDVPDALRSLVIRFAATSTAAGLAGGILLAALGPVALTLLGGDYAAEGTPLVRVMAATLPLVAIMTVYGGLTRLARKLTLAVCAQALNALLILVGVGIASTRPGLAGVGWAYLLADAVVVVVIAVPLWRLAQRFVRSSQPAPVGGVA